MNKLVFENLAIEAGNKKILKNVNLTIEKGDVLALVGPNGQGKSTLLNALMGNTEYKITEGHIYLDDIDIAEFKEIPTYKRMCICILRNDHVCKYMGFALTKEETLMKNMALKQYGKIFKDE